MYALITLLELYSTSFNIIFDSKYVVGFLPAFEMTFFRRKHIDI